MLLHAYCKVIQFNVSQNADVTDVEVITTHAYIVFAGH